MRIVAIDPGTTESAIVLLEDGRLLSSKILPNPKVVGILRSYAYTTGKATLAIEMIASYGMAVGASVFSTCVWIGRFTQAWNGGNGTVQVFRKDIKMHLCGTFRAKDSNIRQALIDRFCKVYGVDDFKQLKGLKKNPGPFYGVASHMWSAIAVGAYQYDMMHITTSKGATA